MRDVYRIKMTQTVDGQEWAIYQDITHDVALVTQPKILANNLTYMQKFVINLNPAFVRESYAWSYNLEYLVKTMDQAMLKESGQVLPSRRWTCEVWSYSSPYGHLTAEHRPLT